MKLKVKVKVKDFVIIYVAKISSLESWKVTKAEVKTKRIPLKRRNGNKTRGVQTMLNPETKAYFFQSD